jgi:hypothetical protein
MSEFGDQSNEALQESTMAPEPGEETPRESIPIAAPDDNGGKRLGTARPGNGGKRAGAGRPRNGTFAPCQGDPAYARNLLSLVMRDQNQPLSLRVKAAMVVATRGHSKRPGPPQSIYSTPIIEPAAEVSEPAA